MIYKVQSLIKGYWALWADVNVDMKPYVFPRGPTSRPPLFDWLYI